MGGGIGFVVLVKVEKCNCNWEWNGCNKADVVVVDMVFGQGK